MVAVMHASEAGSDSCMEQHAIAAGSVPTAPGSLPLHGMHHLISSPAPVFSTGHADEQHLFQSAKAIVQHHFGPVMGATMPMGAPEPQAYPPARGTHEEVCDDPELFQETLRELYDALDIKVAKVMKLGGQELNLHLLYQRVTESGGALQVIRDKLWRDVGDAFHLPKTITSLSYVLKRGYMQYLWDYEQVYFHRKSGQPRVAPPASKYSKDQPNTVQQPPSSTGGYQVAHPAMHMHAVDAAAAMAVAALRGRPEWTTTALTQPSTAASNGAAIATGPPGSYATVPPAPGPDPMFPPSSGIPPPPADNEDCKVPVANISEGSTADESDAVKDSVMHDDSRPQHPEGTHTAGLNMALHSSDMHACVPEPAHAGATSAAAEHGNDAETAPCHPPQAAAAEGVTPAASPKPPPVSGGDTHTPATPWDTADAPISMAHPSVPPLMVSAAPPYQALQGPLLTAVPAFSAISQPQPHLHHLQMPHLPLAAILQSHSTAPLSSLVGKKGSVEAVQAAGEVGLVLTGSIEGQQFMGVLGGSSVSSSGVNTPVATPVRAATASTAGAGTLLTAQSGGAGNEGLDEYELQAPKRARTCSRGPGTAQILHKAPSLPDTIQSLLSRLGAAAEAGEEGLGGDRDSSTQQPATTTALPPLKGVPLSSERAVAIWQELDVHKRSLLQNAVTADEERYRAEVGLRDAQIAAEAAQQRRDSALRAAADTLRTMGQRALSEAERADGDAMHRAPSSMAATTFTRSHQQYMSAPSHNTDTLVQNFADMYFPEHSAAESSGGRMHETQYMWQPYVGRPTEPVHHPHYSHLDAKMAAADDPLMCAVAPTSHSMQSYHPQQLPLMPPGSCPTMPPPPQGPNAFTGGFPYVASNPGGQTAAKRGKESVRDHHRNGPLASPNTHTALLPTNRHMAYPKAPDHLVQPLPVAYERSQPAAQAMEAAEQHQGLAECMDLPLSQGLGDFPLDDALIGTGDLEDMLRLGDDFMLEEPV